MDIYAEEILHHYRHRQNYGRLPRPTHVGEKYNPFCGDRIKVELRVVDGRIAQIKWVGAGCAISQAAASLFSDIINRVGIVDQIKKMTGQQVLKRLNMAGLNPARIKCALLAWEAVNRALDSKTHD